MDPFLCSGSQAPSVKTSQVLCKALSIRKGLQFRTLCCRNRKVWHISSSNGFLLLSPLHRRPRVLTEELAMRPNVNPSKNIIRPLSLSASFGLTRFASKNTWSWS